MRSNEKNRNDRKRQCNNDESDGLSFSKESYGYVTRVLLQQSNNPTKLVIWDLSKASAAHLMYVDIAQIADFVSIHKASRSDGKSAIVASTNLEFGVGRMLDNFAEIKNVPFEVKVFRNLLDAENWISEGELPIVS